MFFKTLAVIVILTDYQASNTQCVGASIEPSVYLLLNATSYDDNETSNFSDDDDNDNDSPSTAHHPLPTPARRIGEHEPTPEESTDESEKIDCHFDKEDCDDYEPPEITPLYVLSCLRETFPVFVVGLATSVGLHHEIGVQIVLFFTYMAFSVIYAMRDAMRTLPPFYQTLVIPAILNCALMCASAWLFFLSSYTFRNIGVIDRIRNHVKVEVGNPRRFVNLCVSAAFVAWLVPLPFKVFGIEIESDAFHGAIYRNGRFSILSTAPLVAFLTCLVLAVFAFERVFGLTGLDMPENLNTHIFFVFLTMVFCWVLGVVILINDSFWGWNFFYGLTVMKVMFIFMGIDGSEQRRH